MSKSDWGIDAGTKVYQCLPLEGLLLEGKGMGCSWFSSSIQYFWYMPSVLSSRTWRDEVVVGGEEEAPTRGGGGAGVLGRGLLGNMARLLSEAAVGAS